MPFVCVVKLEDQQKQNRGKELLSKAIVRILQTLFYKPNSLKRLVKQNSLSIVDFLLFLIFIFSGAETPVYLALLPPNAGAPHGEFVSDKKVQQW